MLSRGVRFGLTMVLLVLSAGVVAAPFTRKVGVKIKKGVFRMNLTSPAFAGGAAIPVKHTCQGEDVSPPLEWEKEPAGTQSLALIVDDPDAPSKIWVHWVMFNIPPGVGGLEEGVKAEPLLPNGTRQGRNDSRVIGWSGPCPPSGVHRYYFKLYALDTVLNLQAGITREQLRKAMEGHILAESQCMGTYQKRPASSL